MAQAEALHATLALVPVEESDEQIARARAAVGDVAVALHELASVQARRELGDDWLPMMSRLRQEKGAAEDMVRDLRRKHQVPSSSVRWKDLTAEDCWAALRNMAPLGALVGPVVGYRNPTGRLSFIVDDELDAVAGRRTSSLVPRSRAPGTWASDGTVRNRGRPTATSSSMSSTGRSFMAAALHPRSCTQAMGWAAPVVSADAVGEQLGGRRLAVVAVDPRDGVPDAQEPG